jgi:hypothetical protein
LAEYSGFDGFTPVFRGIPPRFRRNSSDAARRSIKVDYNSRGESARLRQFLVKLSAIAGKIRENCVLRAMIAPTINGENGFPQDNFQESLKNNGSKKDRAAKLTEVPRFKQ